MLPALLVVYLIYLANVVGDPSKVPTCSDAHGTSMTFTAVNGYKGSYILELCTERSKLKKLWQVEISFCSNRDPCNASLKRRYRSEVTHSKNNESISYEYSCTENQTLCVSAQFDLIFSACYHITSYFKDNDVDPIRPYDISYLSKYFNVTNNLTKDSIENNVAYLDPGVYRENTDIPLVWYTGIPLSEYEVQICLEHYEKVEECEFIINCTTVDRTNVECVLNPPPGCYMMYLTHVAPWVVGNFKNQQTTHGYFCRNSTVESVPPVSGGGWRRWPWFVVGGCAALVAGAVVAALVCRSSKANRRRLDVFKSWLLWRNEHGPVSGARPPCRHVLLLYAPEGHAARGATAALTAALRHVVEGEVLDIFSPAVTAQYAAAPQEWMRSKLQRSDVAVLLLQTPALRARYSTHAGNTLVAPLLGVGAAPRVPSFGDQLLQFALRVIAESGHSTDDYHKYYFATISALPTELFPSVVPYRRYTLPAAGDVLLRDLSPRVPPAPALLDDLTRAINEFVDYVREHPNYLEDELIVMDA